MLTIAHQFSEDTLNFGGINTWINDYLSFTDEPCRILGVSSSTLEKSAIRCHELIPIMHLSTRRKYIPDSLRFAKALFFNRKLLSDFIQVHRIEYVFIIRILKPKSFIQLFIHTDSISSIGIQSESLWKFFKFLYFCMERFALRSANQVNVYSAKDYNRILDLQKKAKLRLAWYNDRIFKVLDADSARNQIVWVGRFELQKNPLLAVRVFNELRKHIKDYDFVMIGSGTMGNLIKDEIRSLDLVGQLKVLNPVTPLELASIFQKTAVLFQTSNFEGAPRILLEAIACGVAIVSNENGDPENLTIEESFGVRTPTNDILDYCNSIQKALKISPVPGQAIENTRGASVNVSKLRIYF